MAGVPRSWYQQQMGSMVPQAGQAIGQGMFQRMGAGQGTEGQRLAAGAKDEGTESKVNAWFTKVSELPREERLSNLEMQPWKNWPKAAAYAKYLAQNMPQPGEVPSTGMQQLRGMEGGPAALGGMGQLLGGKGAGVFPQQYMTPEMGRAPFQQALRKTGGAERFGAPYGAAAKEAFEKYPRAEKPWSMERLWKGEAREAGELVGAEKWWQKTRPQDMISGMRDVAIKNAEDLLGEYGGQWIRSRMEKLGVPSWIDEMSDEQKEGFGLVKRKNGGYTLEGVEGLSPQVQESYLQLLRMEPPKLENFSTAERKKIKVIVQGRRALAIGEETGIPEELQIYLDKPLATMAQEERVENVLALISSIPLPMVRMIVDLISRPTVEKITGLAEERRAAAREGKGWWPWGNK